MCDRLIVEQSGKNDVRIVMVNSYVSPQRRVHIYMLCTGVFWVKKKSWVEQAAFHLYIWKALKFNGNLSCCGMCHVSFAIYTSRFLKHFG